MSSKTKNNVNEEEVTVETLGLISWYARGWLSADERATVDKLLEKHPELKKYLSEEQTIFQQVTQDKSLLDLSALEPTETRLKNVLGRLENIPQKNKIAASQRTTALRPDNLWTKTKAFTHALLNGEASALKYASLASITVFVALLVAFIAPLIDRQPSTAFHPATVQTPETEKQSTATELLIGVNGDTQNAWLQNLLTQNNASMAKIAGKDGLYRIHFKRTLSKEEIESLLRQLNSHKEIIWFAGEAY